MMSTKKEDYEKVMEVLARSTGGTAGTAGADAIKAYVEELEAALKKERDEQKVLFTEALTLVQHELPRSKAGADACAEITAYVDGLNTEFEKMSTEFEKMSAEHHATIRQMKVDEREKEKKMMKELMELQHQNRVGETGIAPP